MAPSTYGVTMGIHKRVPPSGYSIPICQKIVIVGQVSRPRHPTAFCWETVACEKYTNLWCSWCERTLVAVAAGGTILPGPRFNWFCHSGRTTFSLPTKMKDEKGLLLPPPIFPFYLSLNHWREHLPFMCLFILHLFTNCLLRIRIHPWGGHRKSENVCFPGAHSLSGTIRRV